MGVQSRILSGCFGPVGEALDLYCEGSTSIRLGATSIRVWRNDS